MLVFGARNLGPQPVHRLDLCAFLTSLLSQIGQQLVYCFLRLSQLAGIRFDLYAELSQRSFRFRQLGGKFLTTPRPAEGRASTCSWTTRLDCTSTVVNLTLQSYYPDRRFAGCVEALDNKCSGPARAHDQCITQQ